LRVEKNKNVDIKLQRGFGITFTRYVQNRKTLQRGVQCGAFGPIGLRPAVCTSKLYHVLVSYKGGLVEYR